MTMKPRCGFCGWAGARQFEVDEIVVGQFTILVLKCISCGAVLGIVKAHHE